MKVVYFIIFLLTAFPHSQAQKIAINFTETDTVSNMVGFLHSIDVNSTGPGLDLIRPLKPNYWRTLNLDAAKAGRLNETKSIFLISDHYGYPPQKKWLAERKPYVDTTGFKTFMANLLAKTGSLPLVYDIWNEPDLDDFWDGSNLDFFNTFKIAHDEIRRKLGFTAEISGPSINRGADTNLIRRFCDYCLSNNIQLDVLSFHWLYIDNDKIAVDKLSDILLWCRKSFIDNVRYAPLKIKKIVVNEIVNEPMQHNPGFILAHYFYLEKGKADGACKACWDDDYSRPYSNCWVNTLDGLLNIENKKRSSWWATKSYADLSPVRYEVTSTNSPIYSITGNVADNPNAVRIIIGYNDQTVSLNGFPVTLTLNNLNKLSNFPASDRLRVAIYRIENSGTKEFLQPIPVKLHWVENKSSTITLPLLTLNPGDVIYADIIAASKITSTNDDFDIFPLILYPNPSNSEVYLSNIDETQSFQIEIYNSSGRTVYKSNNKIRIDVSNLSKGGYFLKLTQKGKTKIEKFIKN